MSLNNREVDQLVYALRGFIEKLQAATAIADTGGDVPVIADFPNATQRSGLATTAIMAALVNRYLAEHGGSENVSAANRQGPMATT